MSRTTGATRRILDTTIGIVVDSDDSSLSTLGRLQRGGGRRSPFASVVLLNALLDEIPEFDNDAHRNDAARKIVLDCLSQYGDHSVWHYYAYRLSRIEHPFALSFAAASGRLRHCLSSLQTAYDCAVVQHSAIITIPPTPPPLLPSLPPPLSTPTPPSPSLSSPPPSSHHAHVLPHALRLLIFCLCTGEYKHAIELGNNIDVDDAPMLYRVLVPYVIAVSHAGIGELDIAAEIMATRIPTSHDASIMSSVHCGAVMMILDKVKRYEPMPSPLLLCLETAYYLDGLQFMPRVLELVAELKGVNEAKMQGSDTKHTRYLLVLGALMSQLPDKLDNARVVLEDGLSEGSNDDNVMLCLEMELGIVYMLLQRFDEAKYHLSLAMAGKQCHMTAHVKRRVRDAQLAVENRMEAIRVTYAQMKENK